MNPLPCEPRDDDDSAAANFPCAGGLVAGTLALMTTWAAPRPMPDGERPRTLIARKIVSNLFFLRHHPDLGEPLRRVIGKVHERWLPLAQAKAGHDEAVACRAAPLH